MRFFVDITYRHTDFIICKEVPIQVIHKIKLTILKTLGRYFFQKHIVHVFIILEINFK